jgi:hypothetical protein
VRHEATVRYVPAERYGYDERPYRYGYYDRGYRYADYPYSRSYIVSNWRGGYTGDCYTRRLRVSDGDGGWFWSARRVCD